MFCLFHTPHLNQLNSLIPTSRESKSAVIRPSSSWIACSQLQSRAADSHGTFQIQAACFEAGGRHVTRSIERPRTPSRSRPTSRLQGDFSQRPIRFPTGAATPGGSQLNAPSGGGLRSGRAGADLQPTAACASAHSKARAGTGRYRMGSLTLLTHSIFNPKSFR